MLLFSLPLIAEDRMGSVWMGGGAGSFYNSWQGDLEISYGGAEVLFTAGEAGSLQFSLTGDFYYLTGMSLNGVELDLDKFIDYMGYKIILGPSFQWDIWKELTLTLGGGLSMNYFYVKYIEADTVTLKGSEVVQGSYYNLMDAGTGLFTLLSWPLSEDFSIGLNFKGFYNFFSFQERDIQYRNFNYQFSFLIGFALD